jgi:hypothetical protein
MWAPIVAFAYNRPRHLRAVMDSLAKNSGAEQSSLFIYCDGSKSAADAASVEATRRVARDVTGFAKIEIIEREMNHGLSRSIVEGVSEICDRFGRAIVLEDDVVPTPFFLKYVNDGLDRYADDGRVLSIGCHTFDSGFELPETFFLNIPDCWGWGVWQRSWKSFNADGAALLAQIRARDDARKFDFDGAYPYTDMLEQQVNGGNQSWAVRWYAQAFLNEKLVLYPRHAVTRNIGFDGTGTHGGQANGYQVVRAAERPIAVSSTQVHESALGREAWTVALRKMSEAPTPRLGDRLRSHLRRIYRPLVPLLRKYGR